MLCQFVPIYWSLSFLSLSTDLKVFHFQFKDRLSINLSIVVSTWGLRSIYFWTQVSAWALQPLSLTPLFADCGSWTGISSHCVPLFLHQVILSFLTNLKSIICIPFLYLTIICDIYSWWLSLHRACPLKTSRPLLVFRSFYIWHLSVSSSLHNSLNTFQFLAKAFIPALCSHFWAFRLALY